MRTINVIEGIFFAALEKQTPAERNAYLDEACRGDPELRICVDRMLKAQQCVPATIAPCRRRGQIRPAVFARSARADGNGLMASIRASEAARRAQVIDPAWTRGRFSHVRGGSARAARWTTQHCEVRTRTPPSRGPYFVMELVKGQPITSSATRTGWPPQARTVLRCNAIQHAKYVIHPIKPTNVLVALYDGKPI